MKKLFFVLVLLSAVVFGADAQPGQLIIKKGNQGLYLEHKVAPKEGLYAIGRLYNVHPRFIATYNNIELTGLNIGQVVQVPLTDTNFTQKSTSGVPVYYVADANRSLTDIGSFYNKVSTQKLRDWNSLSNDNVASGKKVIVGFLISKEMAAVAANNLVKEQPPRQETKTVANTTTSPEGKPATTEEKPRQKSTPATDKALAKQEPPKEMVGQPKQETLKTEPVFAKEDMSLPGGNDQGYFKRSFEQQVKAIPPSKNETVTAGIFKTTSGWQDAKYYLLIDKLPAGTIVKITNPENNRAIYAKVLGEMNGIRQNQGLNIRISNAASTALGIADIEKFIVKLNY
jgi:hypothetical protein